MSGNGRRRTSCPSRGSPPIPTRTTRSRGSAAARCCAAAAGRPAPVSHGRATAISSRPTATTCSPVFGPARSDNGRPTDGRSLLLLQPPRLGKLRGNTGGHHPVARALGLVVAPVVDVVGVDRALLVGED